MKPNLVVIQPPHVAADSIIERFCESHCETHYVYLVRPLAAFRDDSPAGVRFLKYSPDRLPGFGEIESVVVVGDAEIANRLETQYPAAHHALWNLDASDDELPLALIPSREANVIDGKFGNTVTEPLARAM